MPNRDTALLTTTDRTATDLRVTAYLNAVAAHTGGDWEQHPTNAVYDVAYADSHGDTISPKTLRILGTHDAAPDPVTLALAVPIIASGSVAGSTGSAPIIIQQPTNTSAAKGGIAILTLTAISGGAMTFVWEKQNMDGTWAAVSGQTASSLVLTSITAAQAGSYRCTVSNGFGSTTSASASISVS